MKTNISSQKLECQTRKWGIHWSFLVLMIVIVAGCKAKPKVVATDVPARTTTPTAFAEFATQPTPSQTATVKPTSSPIRTAYPTPVISILVEPNEGTCDFHDISRDEQWVVLSCSFKIEEEGRWGDEMYVRSIGSTEWISLNTVARDRYGAERAIFSPDSRLLIVILKSGEIWLFEAGNWHQHSVLYSGRYNFSTIGWSPDSAKIAIIEIRRGVPLSILYLDGSTRGVIIDETLANNPAYHLPMIEFEWSPESKNIFYRIKKFAKDNSIPRLWSVDVETGKQELVIESEQLKDFEISPNGKKIHVGNTIYDIDKQELDPRKFPGGNVYWSPDSKYYVAVDQFKGFDLVNIETGTWRWYPGRFVWVMHWRDDGKSILALRLNDHERYELISIQLPIE